LGFGIWDLGFGIWDLGFGIWDLGFGMQNIKQASSEFCTLLFLSTEIFTNKAFRAEHLYCFT
jgi:hypothetical protein